MSKRGKKEPGLKPTDKPTAGRGFLIGATAVALAALLMLALWSSRSSGEKQESPKQTAQVDFVSPAAEAKPAYAKLVGKWVRPDGGYVIDIKGADENGKLDAGYFNPNPIHVARAEASGQGSMIKVFIELRDVNYPGSTYTLAYDPVTDQMRGIYYQAVEQQQYDIFFTRLK